MIALVALSAGSLCAAGKRQSSTKTDVPAKSVEVIRFDNARRKELMTASKAETWDKVTSLTVLDDLYRQATATREFFNNHLIQQEEGSSKESAQAIVDELNDALAVLKKQMDTSSSDLYSRAYVAGIETCVERVINASNAAYDSMHPASSWKRWASEHKVALGSTATALALLGLCIWKKDAIKDLSLYKKIIG